VDYNTVEFTTIVDYTTVDYNTVELLEKDLANYKNNKKNLPKNKTKES